MLSNWWDSSRHNGALNAQKIRERGADGICARCVIGLAERDPLYLDTKIKTESEGLDFAAYVVPWPANRDPIKDAENAADKIMPTQANKPPVFVANDAELGTSKDKYGHYLLSGAELVDYYIDYGLRLEQLIAPIPILFYTARWFWNNPKLLPHINQGETRWPLWSANYPFDPTQIFGVRYSPDVLDPTDHNASIKALNCEPWGEPDAWQWTSKARARVDGYAVATFFDRNAFYISFLDPSPDPDPDPGDGCPDWVAADIRASVDAINEQAAELETLAQNVERS